MPSLADLPSEVANNVFQFLRFDQEHEGGIATIDLLADLASLSRSCRALYAWFDPVLLVEGLKRHPYLLVWAADIDNLSAMQKLLEAGADPNIAMSYSNWETDRSPMKNRPTTCPKFTERHQTRSCTCWKRHFEEFYLRWLPTKAQNQARRGLVGEAKKQRYDGWKEKYVERPLISSWTFRWSSPRSPGSLVDYDAKETPVQFWFPIHLAVINGSHSAFELLRAYGAVLEVPSHGLCTTCCVNQREEMLYFRPLEKGMRAPAKSLPLTPLHFAFCTKNDRMAEHILEVNPRMRERVQYNFEAGQKSTPVFISAVRHGALSFAERILEEELSDTAVNETRQGIKFGTMLWLAYWEGLEVLESALPILLRHGADIDVDLGDGHTRLVQTVSVADYGTSLLLMKAGANSNVIFREASTDGCLRHFSTWDCADRGHPQFWLSKYLGNGNRSGQFMPEGGLELDGLRPIDILCLPYFHKTPTYHSQTSGFKLKKYFNNLIDMHHMSELMRVLVQTTRSISSNPLHIYITVACSQLDLLELLHSQGFHTNTLTTSGRSLVFFAVDSWASKREKDPLFSGLVWAIKREIDLALTDTMGLLAKHARKQGVSLAGSGSAILRICRILYDPETSPSRPVIPRALDVWPRDHPVREPTESERLDEEYSLLERLVQHGYDISPRDGNRRTPLMIAFEKRRLATCRILIRLGAKLSGPGNKQHHRIVAWRDDLEYVWRQMLNKRTWDGQAFHTETSIDFLSSEDLDPEERLLRDAFYRDAAVAAGRDDVVGWLDKRVLEYRLRNDEWIDQV